VLDFPCNLGVGAAVQAGLRRARERGFRFVARMDADGQHVAGEIPAMLRKMEESGADFVSGSRFLPGSSFEAGSTPARRLGNKLLARFLSAICRTPITDPTTGLWCVREPLLRYFAHRYPGEYPEPEAMALLRRQGYVMAEVPVRVLPRRAGRSHVRSAGVVYFAFRVGLALLADRVRPVDRRFAAPPRGPLAAGPES
ncbi:MAG: glycosyltransferase family 2 protein, partial [Kiritimatiellae bacterium]|nr:glycosyltransferase family 2 protein [Kiritimatiellia bacterium]